MIDVVPVAERLAMDVQFLLAETGMGQGRAIDDAESFVDGVVVSERSRSHYRYRRISGRIQPPL